TFFFSSRRRHTRFSRDWSSDVCSSDLAKFFIEGDLNPKENDKLDYVSIFNGELDNERFIRNALWLTPQVSWENNDNTYYLMDSRSEERRVGKECRSRCSWYHEIKTQIY